MTLQTVTPEELNAWLQSTDVSDTEEEDEFDLEPLPIEVPVQRNPLLKKRKASNYRPRCSSLDEGDISFKPCFGVDFKALTGDEIQMEKFHNNAKHSSMGSNNKFVENDDYPRSTCSQYHSDEDDLSSFKKRRVTWDINQRQSIHSQDAEDTPSYSNTPIFSLATNNHYKLDDEAHFSRHSSQFTVPSHVIHKEARFSRRSSQFTTVSGSNERMESFLRAMEMSQQSQKMLMSRHQLANSVEEMGWRVVTSESRESRDLLVRLGRRSFG